MMLIELFAWSSPLVVTVTRNVPLVGVTITSECVAVPGVEKNQITQRRTAAEAEYVTTGLRVKRALTVGYMRR
jgi:hypothetical protein